MIESKENTTAFNFEGLSELEIKRQNFPRWGHTIFGVLLLIVELFGLVENSLILFTFFKSKQLRSAPNIFVIGLCTADLCMICLGCPFPLISALSGRWAFSEDVCTLAGFIVYFFGLAQLYLLTAISIDRCIMITRPLKSGLITKRVAVLSCVACFSGGLFWALLPLFGWSRYGLEAPGVFCGLDIDNTQMSYSLAIFLNCFILPFFLMVFCYYRIYATIRNVNKNMVWDMSSRIARKNLKLETKMMKTCILMCCSYWACWFPYALVFFWQVLYGVDSIPLVLTEIPALAAKSQGVLNPFIYGVTNEMFRQAFYKCLPCAGLSARLVEAEEERRQRSMEAGDTDDDAKNNPINNANNNPYPNAVAPAVGIAVGLAVGPAADPADGPVAGPAPA